MPFFYLDQGPARARCEELVARLSPATDADHELEVARAKRSRRSGRASRVNREIRINVARTQLQQLLEACVLVPGATAEGVAWLLIESHATRDPDATRRTIARAIPVRGAVRPGRACVALLVLVAGLVLLVWFLGWLWAGVVLLGVWILDSPVRHRVSAEGRAIQHVLGMERAARAAEEAGDVAALTSLHAEAGRMIAEDRVPARVGFSLAHVLGAAAITTSSPVELLHELQQLLFIAPETEHSYWQVRDTIERRARKLQPPAEAPPAGPPRPRHEPRPTSRLVFGKLLASLRRRRVSRDMAELRAAVAASASPEEAAPRVLALYRQVRDAAVRKPGGRRDADLVTAMRMAAAWASNHGDSALLGEIRDDARALIAGGRVPAGGGTALADVLRECVRGHGFPTTLLDDYAALWSMVPAASAPHFWSIVDAAILRVEERVREIGRDGTAGTRAALVETAAAFEATAARASDPEIALRARKLAALAVRVKAPSP